MPSGFQQDINQLQPAFYRVVIDMSNETYDVFCRGGTGTCHGVVNPYAWDNWSGADLPSTNNNAIRLARGNIRWARIIEELGRHADAQILDLEVSFNGSTNGDAEPTQIAFTVKYDRYGINVGDEYSGVLQAERKYLQSINNGEWYSPYDNENINHTYEAVQEAIMRALIEEVTRSVRVYDTDRGEGIQSKVTVIDVTDGGNYSTLRDAIQVNLLDGSTVINP